MLATPNWRRLATSLVDFPDAIAVQSCSRLDTDEWPQDIDLRLQSDGSVYALCHTNDGITFLHALARHLESSGYDAAVDDDYY